MKLPAAHGAQDELPSSAMALPALHGWHASALAAPSDGLKWPSPHAAAVALVLPSAHQWPAAHAPTHCALVWLVALPKRPAAHGSGALVPLVQKAPTGHAEHSSCDVRLARPPSEPASHGIGCTLPSAPWWPSGQGSHLVAPAVLTKLPPGGSGAIAAAISAAIARLQTPGCNRSAACPSRLPSRTPAHGSHDALPSSAAALPALHDWHASALAAPSEGLKCPLPHAAAVALVLPASHV